MTDVALVTRQLTLIPHDDDAAEIGRVYHRAKASLIEVMKDCIECGHRLIAKKTSLKTDLGHGSWLPWLEQNADTLGFETLKAQRLMKLAAANTSSTTHLNETNALAISRKLWGNAVKPFKVDDEWYTPLRYVEAARKVLGDIDLDPASNESAQAGVKAARWYGKAEDGLAQPWSGRVWLNPPYTKQLLAQFVTKLIDEYQSGQITAAIMLGNNFTDSDWFQAACGACAAVCFPRDRIYFEHRDGKIDRPLNGQVMFYFGADPTTFRTVFASIGAGFIGRGSWSWDGTK